jgi:hypothetical protein
MRSRLRVGILLASTWASAQTCSTYVVADPFDHKTTMGINGLQAEDFQAKLGNTVLPIVKSTQTFDARLLVLFETSGTAEDPGLAQQSTELANLAAQAPPGKMLAFGVFAERALFGKGFSSNPQDRRSTIDELMAHANSLGKRTALYDALHQALALFGQHQPGDAILLVSDGFDDASKRNGVDLDKEFQVAGTRLLVMMRPQVGMVKVPNQQFRWTPDKNLSWKASPGKGELAHLSSSSGGSYTGFNPHFVEFAWAGYLLEIAVPSALDKPKEWTLQLRGTSAREHPEALIYHPWKLLPCQLAK